MTQNLLVVDWDYFFPVKHPNEDPDFLYDWSHSESLPFFREAVWQIRAATFDRAGVPRPVMNKDWIDFWDRFDISDDATLYYGDSNVLALREEVRRSTGERTAQVWLYDAHHDCGYERDLTDMARSLTFTCEDWMIGYRLIDQAQLHVRYPDWKPWAMKKEPQPQVAVDRAVNREGNGPAITFDTVFVCRSGAWVPPWADHDFQDFVTDAPVNEIYELEDCQPRDWDEDFVQRLAAAETELMKKIDEVNQSKAAQTPQEPS
jgi:hypothetical protein